MFSTTQLTLITFISIALFAAYLFSQFKTAGDSFVIEQDANGMEPFTPEDFSDMELIPQPRELGDA